MLVFGLPKKPFHLFGHSAINLSLLKFIREFFFLKTLSAFQTTLIADFFFFFFFAVPTRHLYQSEPTDNGRFYARDVKVV